MSGSEDGSEDECTDGTRSDAPDSEYTDATDATGSEYTDDSRSEASGSRSSRSSRLGGGGGSESGYSSRTAASRKSSRTATSRASSGRSAGSSIRLVTLSKQEYRARRKARDQAALTAATTMQRYFRAYLARRELAKLDAAAKVLQRAFRGWRSRRVFRLLRAQVATAQTCVRGFLARRRFVPVLRAHRYKRSVVIKVQAMWRGRMLRHSARRREAAHLAAMLAPAQRDLRKGAESRAVPVVALAARGMLKNASVEDTWQSMMSLRNEGPDFDLDLEYRRFCFSAMGWASRVQWFPPQVSHASSGTELADTEIQYVQKSIQAHAQLWGRLRPEERCVVLEMDRGQLRQLAEKDWRAQDPDNPFTPPPLEVLMEHLADAEFLWAVQKMFLQCIEGDGSALLDAEIIYTAEQRCARNAHSIPRMSRAQAIRKYRFPWSMPFIISEPPEPPASESADVGEMAGSSAGLRTTRTAFSQTSGSAAEPVAFRTDRDALTDKLHMYCLRCTRYRSESEFFQLNIKHSIRFCRSATCDLCRSTQMQMCWHCATEDASVSHLIQEEMDSTSLTCCVVHWLFHVLDERLHAAVGETHAQLDFLLGRGAQHLGQGARRAKPKKDALDEHFTSMYREQHIFGFLLPHVEEKVATPALAAPLRPVQPKSNPTFQSAAGFARDKKYSKALDHMDKYVRASVERSAEAAAANRNRAKNRIDAAGADAPSGDPRKRRSLFGPASQLPAYVRERDIMEPSIGSGIQPGGLAWGRLMGGKR